MEKNQNYDVIIVGAGPAGIFTALELINQIKDENFKVAVFEKGKAIEKRECPRSPEGCIGCKECAFLNGWGGSGAFSDGKLTLSTEVGGWLNEYYNNNNLQELIDEIGEIFIEYGADRNRLIDPIKDDSRKDKVFEYKKTALKAGIELVPFKILHIGTDVGYNCLQNMYNFLSKQKNVDIFFQEPVDNIIYDNGVKGIKTKNGIYSSKYIVAATGREGAGWLKKQAENLKFDISTNPVDLGVRVEIPAILAKDLTDLLYEFKCIYYSPTFDQKVRTFCVSPYGEVTMEHSGSGIVTVNGHSYADKSKRTENTNFAILVSSNFTYPFKEPILYGEHIAKLANLLSDGQVILQRLSDLKNGRRSTDQKLKRSSIKPTLKSAVAGDLSFVLPYRHVKSIVEFIRALDSIIPGINSNNTLLYGVEAKFYSSKIAIEKDMEVKNTSNFYAIGDGAGITRSLVQASVSGLIAGRSIANKYLNIKNN